jgi:D-beta-D-heptose 7-phosphate kinase / D-beta-D-heptose 1-phosphate adenosyltransferase
MHANLPEFSNARVLVVGDVMLDSYVYGGVTRISPEAPIPVVHVRKTEERAGGAANVALNVAAIGAAVTLLGLVGDDAEADILEDKLRAAQISYHLQRVSGLPTINKLRVMGRNQQLLRLDFEEKFHPQNSNMEEFLRVYEENLDDHDVVILSDYGKGALSAVQELIIRARRRDKIVLIDPKSKDFSIYSNASLITPNLEEFEAVAGVCHGEEELELKAHKLVAAYNLQGILITRGAQGMSLIYDNLAPMHVPAKAREVYDVTGAGDTVIAILGSALAAGSDLVDAMVLANSAAGVVVRKLGAATVSAAELRRAMQREQHTPEAGILNEEQLLEEVADARAHGEKIVMTNGCFDVLHAGHITYLEQAKALGQRLIIAVNDDASTARLKGPKRPINALAQRMLVLAALRAVDWVVPFSEDTPARLIETVQPDVLVKGGDYQAHEIAGADFVLRNGGEVKILSFVDGFSTTSVLEKMDK